MKGRGVTLLDVYGYAMKVVLLIRYYDLELCF